MTDQKGTRASRSRVLLIASITLATLAILLWALWGRGAVTALSGAVVVVSLGALAIQITRTGRPVLGGVLTGVTVVLGLCTSGFGWCAGAVIEATANGVALTRLTGPDGIAYLEHPTLRFLVPDLGEDFEDDPATSRLNRPALPLLGEAAEIWTYVDSSAARVSWR